MMAARTWLEGERERLAPWLAIAAMTGDASYFGLLFEPAAWLGAVIMLAGLLLAGMRQVIIGLALAGFGFGFAAAQLASLRAPSFVPPPRQATIVTGTVAEADGARLTLRAVMLDGHPLGPRVLRLRAAAVSPGVEPGARIQARSMLRAPTPPAYPGARDPQRDAWFNGSDGTGYVLGSVQVLEPASANQLSRMRTRIANRVGVVLPGADGAIATTLLTGLSSTIPEQDRAAFRDSGLSHLLAIAGLHIGIVMGLALTATRSVLLLSERAALFWPVRQICALTALLAGLGYLLLTGMHVPTLRSFVMAAVVVLALLVGRRAVSLRSWAVAALAAIAVSPEAVTGPSFQLSFAAVMALIAGYEVVLRRSRDAGEKPAGHWLLRHAGLLGLTSLLAGGASLPFIAYHFGSVQLYFVLANLLAVPLTAVWIMPAGLGALLLMPFGLDRPALLLMGQGIDIVLRLARGIAALPGATLPTPHVPLAAMLLCAFGLAWLCLWRGRPRLLGLMSILAGVVTWSMSTAPDLLVDADARLAAVRQGRELATRAVRGGNAYVLELWTRYEGEPSDALPCAADGCAMRAGRWTVAFGGNGCGSTVSVVLDGSAAFCPGSLVIDRASSARDGATAVWLAGRRVVLRTDRQMRGRRPWVFLAPEQAIAAVTLPFARIEVLPDEPVRFSTMP